MAKITNTSKVTTTYKLPDQTEKTSEIESNLSVTENMSTSFTKVKNATKEYVITGEEVEITTLLTNISDYDVTDVSLVDTITGGTFKPGSVTIGSTPYIDMDPTTGIELPSSIAKQSGSTLISYTVVANNEAGVSKITIDSEITYTVNERTDLKEDLEQLSINISQVGLEITKTSDKTAVISGETLTFQNVVKNIGTLTHTSVRFFDTLPVGTQFVVGSVKIDKVSQPTYDPTTGFDLEDLTPNKEIEVTFDVTVE